MWSRLLLYCLLALLVPGTVTAQQAARVWSLGLDNDDFALWRSVQARTDRDYSSGIELELSQPLASSPNSRWTRTGRFSLAQRLYTPDIKRAEPAPDDRPYAALLTGRVALQLENPRTWHEFGGAVSVTGPPALGRELQSLVHELTGSAAPMGWDGQLPFRIGLAANYAGASLLLSARTPSALGFDLAGLWGVDVGMFRSALSLGTRATVGLRPTRPWARNGHQDGQRGTRMFLIGGLGLDVVAYDATLRHSQFNELRGLDARSMVLRAEAGLGAALGGISFSWTGVVTGREFEGQPGPHAYGSFRIAVR